MQPQGGIRQWNTPDTVDEKKEHAWLQPNKI